MTEIMSKNADELYLFYESDVIETIGGFVVPDKFFKVRSAALDS